MTEQISAQQIFDTVWKRFVVEMAPRAYGIGGCFYACHGTTARCAVGVIMTKEEAYIAQTHGGSVGWLAKRNALPRRLLPHVDLLKDLQTAHDDGRAPGDPEPDPMRGAWFSTRSERAALLTRIANIHGLEVPS
jgi:hypothetical protein